MLLNCGVGEDSWESLGLQGDPTGPFWILLNVEKEQNPVICNTKDGPSEYYANWNVRQRK